MGEPWGRRGTGQGDGGVPGGVIRRQEPHEVKAAGVEAGDTSGAHHQDLLGVVVQGGDTGRHADSEGEPGHTDGDTGRGHKRVFDIPVQEVCNQGVHSYSDLKGKTTMWKTGKT